MKQIAKNTVEAIVRLIENADKQEAYAVESKHNVITVAVSSEGKIVFPMDVAVGNGDIEALRLMTVLSNSTIGFSPTNELDNASRDIAREVFGEQVRRAIIWSRTQSKNAVSFQMMDVSNFNDSVNKMRNLFEMIDELYDDNGFIVTGIY